MEQDRNDKSFTLTKSCDFILSEAIACNPWILKKPDTDMRKAFKAYQEQLTSPDEKRLFPSLTDIRNQTEVGEGLHLLSGGGFIFVEYDETVILPMLYRTHVSASYWIDFNGQVAEPGTIHKEIYEELNLVEITADNKAIVYVPDFETDALAKQKKGEQKANIRHNLLLHHGIEVADFSWKSTLVMDVPLSHGQTITLKDRSVDGEIVGTMIGMTGFEGDQSNLACRVFGRMTIEAQSGSRLFVVDGEFDKIGRFFTEQEMRAAIANDNALRADQRQILPSAAAMLSKMKWPRRIAGKASHSALRL